MGKITFDLTTNPKSRKGLKKQLYEYCVDNDYQFHVHEKREPLESVLNIDIDVPDGEMTEALKVIKTWGELIAP